MSENAQEEVEDRTPWSAENDPDGFTREDIAPKDAMLTTLMSLVLGYDDELDGDFGLTIQSGGAVITGTVISREKWFNGTVDQLTGAGAGNLAEAVRELYDHASNATSELQRRREAEGLPDRARAFIHMKDARVLVGDSRSSVNFPLWRGTLSDITGWSLGVATNE